MTEVSTNPTTRTALVPLAITCPNWCDEEPEFHVRELPNTEGICIHPMPRIVVDDEEGFQPWGPYPRRFSPSIDVWLSVAADLTGRETEPAVMFVDGKDLTVQQALDLAKEIKRQVKLYRSCGGVS